MRTHVQLPNLHITYYTHIFTCLKTDWSDSPYKNWESGAVHVWVNTCTKSIYTHNTKDVGSRSIINCRCLSKQDTVTLPLTRDVQADIKLIQGFNQVNQAWNFIAGPAGYSTHKRVYINVVIHTAHLNIALSLVLYNTWMLQGKGYSSTYRICFLKNFSSPAV